MSNENRADIIALLSKTMDETPELTIAQFLTTLLRTRGNQPDPFFWSDSRLRQELQHMRKSLKDFPLGEDTQAANLPS
jgi:hypothetical protein